MKNIGSRAEVFHENAKKTKGNLKKKDLKINKYGNIVSKKQSQRMKGKNNPLRKLGYLQYNNSGEFGPKGKYTKNTKKNEKKGWLNLFLF